MGVMLDNIPPRPQKLQWSATLIPDWAMAPVLILNGEAWAVGKWVPARNYATFLTPESCYVEPNTLVMNFHSLHYGSIDIPVHLDRATTVRDGEIDVVPELNWNPA